jgi:hypothetical protein
METAVPLPVELIELVVQALPRLNRQQRGRLALDLSGGWWGLRCVVSLPSSLTLSDTLPYRTAVLVDSVMLSNEDVAALNRGLKVCFLAFPPQHLA